MNDVGLRGGDRVAWRIWGIMVECVPGDGGGDDRWI
jgi:hypothetical protein